MATTSIPAESPSKAFNIVLWVLQFVLAGMFGMAGFMKLTAPVAELSTQMQWAGDIPELLLRFIGLSELLGGIGLIVPALTRIRPALTSYAGYGLALIMLLAAIFHVTRGEYTDIVINLILLALTAFVAWGRSKKAPVAAKA